MSEEQELEILRESAARNAKMIDQSRIFMSLFTKGYEKEPVPLMQIALAILMDKPIGLVVFKGAVVPEHLKKIAFYIEYIEMDEQATKDATERLLKKAKELKLL